ncbi:RNA dependent RNA polymerase [Psychrobacillus sp. BM2]|uniref:RNA dependent RNA polymerase n=1 Tax=Psychrobacillus sp. BM2 TaxID=3400421 RepID=UPI003B01C696
MTNNKPTYIRSIEASSIFNHIEREEHMQVSYTGMIPFSLELIQLRKQKSFKEFSSKRNIDKLLSDSIINVKFQFKVNSGQELIEKLNKSLKERKSELEKIDESEEKHGKLTTTIANTKQFIELIKSEAHLNKWNGMGIDELRSHFYSNGFTIVDEKGKSQKYVVYKRSSAKSRTGECLFIREDLYEDMISWSRLNLSFEKGSKIDLASLLSYESLVGSSIIDTIQIDPNSILLIDDVDSEFKKNVNLIATVNRKLESNSDEVTIKNSIWDGESLLDSSFYDDGVSMLLLRNSFYKSAAFNTNIQMFLQNNCPTGQKYDEWYLEDMFGNKILAKEVRMITTPNSVKILKFANDVQMTKNEIYEHWKTNIGEWGVCKTEKKSKRGEAENGMPLQQMSYQMINSLPATKKDIYELTAIERQYIDELKNNEEAFIEHLIETKDDRNANEMYIALYEHNPDIAKTPFFKDYKATKINKYAQRLKKGKVRVVGDYLVLFGNPYEMLLHSIGKFEVNNEKPYSLKENEVVSSLFNEGDELVGFRNPHSSASNVLIAKNVSNKLISKYFNLSKNVVAVNSIGFELQDLLSGSDYDSDTIFCSNDKTLLRLAKECQSYNVCINGVGADSTEYVLSNEDMSVIDSKLSQSQFLIGTVVNLGQLANSIYWDLLSQNRIEEAKEVMKKVDIVTILSGLTIDAAKRMYKTNVRSEIAIIQSFLQQYMPLDEVINADGKKKTTVYKPMFFKNIDQNASDEDKKKVVKYKSYMTPMDFLGEVISEIPRAKKTSVISTESLLVKHDISKTNYNQYYKLSEIADEFIGQINVLSMGERNDETYRETDELVKLFHERIKKFKVKPITMYAILSKMLSEGSKKTKKDADLSEVKNSRLLNSLYLSQKEIFINSFI